jgi:NAD(P)-dependent dehydrogenase (short-subunit alcohol dehydrogenase family)
MKTIFITGANKGIGFEIARQLLEKGHRVIISGRDEARIREALGRLQKENHSVEAVVMDVSKEESIKAAAATLAGRKIQIDVLINNAAILDKKDNSLLREDFAIIEETLQINAKGVLHVIRHFFPLLRTPARIVNVSSDGGSMSDPIGGWAPAYCVSKSLLNAITRHLAHELRGANISVNAVCPGWVRTDMGGSAASRPVEKGAETPVWLAIEAPEEFTGMFFRDKERREW